MKVFVKIEHYPPGGTACVSLIAKEFVKRFDVLLGRPEKERERNIRNVLRKLDKLEVGCEILNWTTHKLDQMAAEQREWDEYTKGRHGG